MNRDSEQFKHDILPLQPAMQRMAESLLENEDEAADVVQDCFVALWNQRDKLHKVLNKEAWCIAMVKHHCLDALRRKRPTLLVDEQLQLYDYQPEPDNRLQLVMKLMERLPERQAQVVRMKHFDAVDTKEIAKSMQTTEGNIYVLLSRAYNNLKQMIAKYEREG